MLNTSQTKVYLNIGFKFFIKLFNELDKHSKEHCKIRTVLEIFRTFLELFENFLRTFWIYFRIILELF